MTDAGVFHVDDTIALEAELPRDLTDSSVTLLFGEEETGVSAVIEKAGSGVVAVPLSQISPKPGVYEIKWRIENPDGTVEVLPPDGDVVRFTD